MLHSCKHAFFCLLCVCKRSGLHLALGLAPGCILGYVPQAGLHLPSDSTQVHRAFLGPTELYRRGPSQAIKSVFQGKLRLKARVVLSGRPPAPPHPPPPAISVLPPAHNPSHRHTEAHAAALSLSLTHTHTCILILIQEWGGGSFLLHSLVGGQ